MQNTRLIRRMVWVAVLLGFAYCGLAARLVVLQGMQHEQYRDMATRTRTYLTEPRRGDIRDINGNLLATSEPMKRVFANPRFLGPWHTEVAAAIAPLLGYDAATLADLIRPVPRLNEKGEWATNAWVNLKREVSLDQWKLIASAMTNIPAGIDVSTLPKTRQRDIAALRYQSIYAEDHHKRVYPGGRLASHVLGYVHEKDEEFNDALVTSTVGQYGIEGWFDTQMRGTPGWRVTETDFKRRELVVYRKQEVDPKPGLTVVLTIDSVLQDIVTRALDGAMKQYSPDNAHVVIVRPRTGEILALASYPDFNPNFFNKATDSQLRNRVISDRFEPGSTFKIVAASGAINDGLFNLSSLIDCENGLWYYCGKPLKDHGRYSVISLEHLIWKSSNIGMAKIGLKMGERRLHEYVRAYGFGERTGLPLTGEDTGGLVAVEKWFRDKLKITRVPMGQGITVTHIQLAMAMSAVANEGRRMRPMLVSRLENPDGSVFAQYQPEMVRQVVSERAARQLVTALKGVVSTNGTANKARLEHYTVAGKTGTAQKAGIGGYTREYVASFAGFFPADDPELCITVVLDNPDRDKGYYGGQTSAVVFKSIAEQAAQYLKIKPDREEPPREGGPTPASSTKPIAQARL